ncbi:MAG: radical SAM protein, partial [bacterium]
MLNLTKLYCGVNQPHDDLRYGQGAGAPMSAAARKPIVVWNITRRCNLNCLHCYSDSEAREYPNELTWEECRAVIADLAAFGVPGLLLSGGEPLLHPRFFDIAAEARAKGLRVTLSTNATLLDKAAAQKIKSLGLAYVGISLDGIGATHDRFRGRQGAFEKTARAFQHCKEAGQKVGLRLTLSRHTVTDLDRILDFVEQTNIDRVCFYHLVGSGRGATLQFLSPDETRSALERILARTLAWAQAGTPREVLTVDQPADNAYLWLKMKKENHPRARQVLDFLLWNGGGANSSGVGIGNIDSQGEAHPDQFWQTHFLGNVKQTPFSKIWTQSTDPLLIGLRNRLPLLQGRCARCRLQRVCGGGVRARAFHQHG